MWVERNADECVESKSGSYGCTIMSELKSEFRRDGYVSLREFLDVDAVKELRQHVDRFISDVVPTMASEHVFYESKGKADTLKQLQQMFAYDDYFDSLMFGSRFEDLAAELLGNEVTGVNMQYFNKPPDIGQATPAHQDGYYFMLEPNEAVTMWLALEDVDEETGCVRYVKGSHEDGLRPHGQTATLGFSQGLLDYGARDEEREVAFPAGPGDLLVHHALTIHRADGNRSSTRTRKALGFIYYSAAAKENEEKQNRQAQLVERWKQQGKL